MNGHEDYKGPKAMIYVVRGPGVTQAFKKIKDLLASLDVPPKFIEHKDITSDMFQQDDLRTVVGNKNFPIVFVGEEPVGVRTRTHHHSSVGCTRSGMLCRKEKTA